MSILCKQRKTITANKKNHKKQQQQQQQKKMKFHLTAFFKMEAYYQTAL